MKQYQKRYYIEELEGILKVQRKTLYYWEKTGKVPKAHRDPMSNYRYWYAEDIRKLKKITGRG